MLPGILMTYNAIESNVLTGAIAQANRPEVARFPESIHTQKNISFGEIAVAANTPVNGRDMAEIESRAQKQREKRQEGATESWGPSKFCFRETETCGSTCAARRGTTCGDVALSRPVVKVR